VLPEVVRYSWLVPILFVLGCHDASKDIQALADRACACTDKTCGDKVVDDFVTWAKANKEARGDSDKAAKAFNALVDCAVKAGSALDDIHTKIKPVLE
jgi:hypothetical protein